ncbi:hypothetical protein EMCG_00454 [[Emmonsia] crescens]|uniref:Uncharacterized protein n=1 Tax=[Emmonsia] crescens TaxID=73230 RepID=A0A0G2HWX3_9EURO|nr:hypothetical protein EMCG_00454 [Emmonsia crescens UAMH 3008]
MPALLQRYDPPLSLRLKLIFYRYWSRVRNVESPLHLRYSLGRLRHSPRPWLALLRLFIPYPTWHFPVPEPLSPRELLGNQVLMFQHRHNLVNLTAITLWRARDTSLRSLYRLLECMLSTEYSPIGQETEYFWYQRSWSLDRIPDPADPDPVRYAILASLAEELVIAFNWRLSLGMRRNKKHIFRQRGEDPWPPYTPVTGPAWTKDVPPIFQASLDELPPEFVRNGCQLVLEEKGISDTFGKRNIVTNVGWLYTI